ncbi:hypothetical protein BJ956_000044 [Arthrobacter psychrochitiniphilus]|nr:hypothetical protein [Arthrobacter psychrochitiniphilus]
MDDSFGPNDHGTCENEADREFLQLRNSMGTPRYNECLVCFLGRVIAMLEPAGSP